MVVKIWFFEKLGFIAVESGLNCHICEDVL